MPLIDLLFTTRIGLKSPTFLVLEDLPEYRKIKIVLPDGRIVDENADQFEEPQEGSEENVTKAQIGSYYLFQVQEKQRAESEARKLMEREIALQSDKDYLSMMVLTGKIECKSLAAYAKQNGLLRPDQRKFLFNLGMRSVRPLDSDETEELTEILLKLRDHFSRT